MRHDRMRHEVSPRDKTKTTVRILSAVVIVLVLFIAFFFVVKPQVNKYALNRQIEGANYVYSDILTNIQQNGYYAIPVGNQTLVLVPYTPTAQDTVETGTQ